MGTPHTGFCEKKTADPLLECVDSTPDLLVYKLMYLTILSNFLQPAPLKKKQNIILSPMELLENCSSEPYFQPGKYGHVSGRVLGFVPANRWTTCRLLRSLVRKKCFLRLTSEQFSSSNKLRTHAFCQREPALLISKLFNSA